MIFGLNLYTYKKTESFLKDRQTQIMTNLVSISTGDRGYVLALLSQPGCFSSNQTRPSTTMPHAADAGRRQAYGLPLHGHASYRLWISDTSIVRVRPILSNFAAPIQQVFESICAQTMPWYSIFLSQLNVIDMYGRILARDPPQWIQKWVQRYFLLKNERHK